MSSAERRLRLAAAVLVLAAAGCRQDMHDQPKYEPFEASAVFADGAASRRPVAGTVARGLLREDIRRFRGLEADGSFVAEIPLAVDRAFLERGRERFQIFCSPCHGANGDGQGMIVQRGFKRPQSFHQDRLIQVQDGYFYDVMTNGFGQMSSYAAQLEPDDRWAVVAYVRALQLSRRAPVELLDESERARLDGAAAAPRPAAPAPVGETE